MLDKIGYSYNDIIDEVNLENLKYCVSHINEYDSEEQKIINELVVDFISCIKGGKLK